MARRNTTHAEAYAWRSAFGITHGQAQIVVALIAAKQLGYDGATTGELESIGISCCQPFSELERARLVTRLGFVDGRFACWAPTPAAFRRFGFAVPEQFREPETLEARAERVRDLKRKSESKRRNKRKGEAA